MLLCVVFFLTITTTIVLGIATPILKNVRITQENLRSKQSLALAESALEDMTLRLKEGYDLPSQEIMKIDDGVATTTVITTNSWIGWEMHKKVTITSTANAQGLVRKMQGVFQSELSFFDIIFGTPVDYDTVSWKEVQ